MERKIGEVFYDGTTKLEVVEHLSCGGCHYYDVKKCLNRVSSEIRGKCSPRDRRDKTSIIFKEVKS